MAKNKPETKPNTKSKTSKAKSESSKTSKPVKKQKMPTSRKILLTIFIILLLIAAAGATFWLLCLNRTQDKNQDNSENPTDEPIYSLLTGEEIANAKLNSTPTFCVQIPNADDGARPQAGLTHAGVVFEAIAERGITRFAAVFQNTNTSAIGPIRSLRPYYLEWDTPFNCTVVHAGGSDEAIAAVNNGSYRNLDENYSYMWRENAAERYWNNLFTSPTLINTFNQDHHYQSSEIKAFPRLTPAEAEAAKEDNINTTDCQENDGCIDTETATATAVTEFEIDFGRLTSFNTVYTYDAENNRYLRSYESGEPHLVFDCPSTLNQPQTFTECGEPIQVTPSAIVAMFVRESVASDNYHEDITTVGSGKAYVFQNGTVETGTWTKSSISSQIVFRNDDGEEIAFTPGQLWIAAVPQYGGVEY